MPVRPETLQTTKKEDQRTQNITTSKCREKLENRRKRKRAQTDLGAQASQRHR